MELTIHNERFRALGWQVHNQSYAASLLGPSAVLYDYYRLNTGGAGFGEGLTPGREAGHRQWADEAAAGVNLT